MAKKDTKQAKDQAKVDCGHRLQAVRLALGFSARDRFAELMGVSAGQVANWEAGNNFPRPEFLIRLAERYGVTSDYILRHYLGGIDQHVSERIEECWRKVSERRASRGQPPRQHP